MSFLRPGYQPSTNRPGVPSAPRPPALPPALLPRPC